MTTVHCLTQTMELERERVGCCKPSYTTTTDCPALNSEHPKNVKFVKFHKVPCPL